MTSTGHVPRLCAHLPEPFAEIHPADAAAAGLEEGGFARLENGRGGLLARIRFDAGQRRGSVFVPMHWSDAFAREARVNDLVAPDTDYLSGQPASKHARACISPWHPRWQGFLLARCGIDVPGADWCARIRGEAHIRHEIAGTGEIPDGPAYARELLGEAGEWLELYDAAGGRYRAARVADGRLDAVLFLAPDRNLPDRGWLGSLFAKERLDAADRAGLLAARPPAGAEPAGRVVCACRGVGETRIREAIRDQGLETVDDIGRALGAGTQCGSCRPELRALLGVEQNEAA